MRPLAEIAQLEERRQSRGLAHTAPESRDIAGGVMGRGTPGLWYNNSVGLGFAGPVSAEQVHELIEFHTERGIEPRIEACPYADKSLHVHLAAAGFVVRQYENTFFRELEPLAEVQPPAPPPAGLELFEIDPRDDATVREWAVVCVSGFVPGGGAPSEEMLVPVVKTAREGRYTSVAARLDGEMIGAGGMEASDGVASLFGVSVRPDFRRRGVQQALVAYRLTLASRRGCTLATIGSIPGTATERNARRMGFALAYTKPHMVRPGPGLTPNAE